MDSNDAHSNLRDGIPRVGRIADKIRFAASMPYGLPILSVGVALGVGLVLQNFHFRVPATALLLFAVAVVSWKAGRGPAVLAVILATISCYWFFVGPVSTIYINYSEIPYFIIFAGFAVLLCWFGTIRRRIEAGLREQASLLNLTHDAIFVMDMEGVIKYWNRAAEERYGWPAEQVVGKVVHDLLKTGFPGPLEEIRAEVTRTGRWEGEIVHTKKDGTQVVVASHWALQRDAHGAPVAILETNNDITERKRNEAELRASEERFRTLVQFSFDVYWESDAQHRFTRQEFAEGLADAPASGSEIGKTRWEVPYLEPDEAAWRQHRATLDAHLPFRDFELARPAPDGGKRYVSVSGLPVFDATGRFTGYRGVGRHITDRKRAEQALRQSEAYLAEAQRLSHTGSWAFDVASDKYVYVSEECLRIFELDAQGGLPTRESVSRLIHPEDWDSVKGGFETSLRDKVDTSSEFRITLPSGTAKHIQAIRHPVLNDAGDVVKLVGTVVDMTDRKRAEEERQGHLWVLESLNRINRVMQGSGDLERMLSDVLGAVLSVFACDRAWLVYPCDPEAASWKVPMEHTRPEFPGAFALGLDLPVTPEIAQVLQTVKASSGPVRFGPGSASPLPPEVARRFSIQSMLCMAIYPKGDRPYMLGLHECSYPRVWTPQEERLFQEIGRRLADALTSVLIFRTLRESEERYRTLFERANDPVFLENERDEIIEVNQRACALLGYSREELLTMKVSDLQAPEIRGPAGSVVRGEIERHESAPFETVDLHRSGRRIAVEVTNTLIVHQGQNLVLSIVRDITDRKRAQEALRRSEAYLAEGQRLSHAGSWAWNPLSEQCFYWSEEMFRIFEIDPQQGLPTREIFWARIHPEDRESMREVLGKSALEKTDYAHDHRILLPDGTVKHIHAIGHPVLDEAGELVEFIGTAIDVTERKRAEEQRDRLRQLEMELAHINRVSMMGELTASIAHEVNQPLAGVVSNAGASLRWLAGDPPNLDRAREAILRIVRDGKRAGEIIARVRALTRSATTPTEKLDLNETIREVLALTGDEAKRNSVMVETKCAEDVFPVQGDRVQLQQVLLNLIMNAIEAMSSVTVRARALVITTRNLDPDQVQVMLEDAGIGLDPNAMDKIFDPFYTTKPGGMGMGLSISRSILEAHGGRLWAGDKDGPGTMFHFTLPEHHEDESDA